MSDGVKAPISGQPPVTLSGADVKPAGAPAAKAKHEVAAVHYERSSKQPVMNSGQTKEAMAGAFEGADRRKAPRPAPSRAVMASSSEQMGRIVAMATDLADRHAQAVVKPIWQSDARHLERVDSRLRVKYSQRRSCSAKPVVDVDDDDT